MSLLRQTPMYPEYNQIGKMVEFCGWELPVQYSGLLHEHEATRTKAGLFDVSHMGQISIIGKDSLDFLQKMVTNDVSKLSPNKVQYALMCNEEGGTIDDFLLYKKSESEYILVVNACNIEKNMIWLNKHWNHTSDLEIINESDQYAVIALQGPCAEKILNKVTSETMKNLKPFTFKSNILINNFKTTFISRTGYTGEDGFEIYMPSSVGRSIWKALVQAGKEFGMEIAGLGARDTLRLEAGLPLYSQELSETITPIEARLDFAVKIHKKANFIGRDVLKNQLEYGVDQKIIGIEMIEKGIPRHGYVVLNEKGEEIGIVTSGTYSPTLKKNIGLALVKAPYFKPGNNIWIQIRKKTVLAKVIEPPFYRRSKK
ncbi:glycine cleavage system aminomethyltransferase GcvT [Pseudogracilibacillus sp. SE30717A]|uniref:glycine cleavage system aminomethyltransferase GcvT n=1 Tax=Pseudogracilibacillus sp. SE30717A TaxID=3098293 RepID=UPI00300E151F